jgi:hypothetical protein
VAAGCALLSEQARQNVESVTATRCADALGKLNLAGGAIGEVSVWGDDAQAKLDSGALFLAEFRSGWKVTGAGCTFRGEDLPYDCDVKA